MNDIEIYNEEWRDVVGYEGLYAVSNFGRIKSLNYNRTKQEKILRPIKCKNGYLAVNLWKDGKMKQYYIHRLVATAFIENPLNLPTVNHKNEIKTDNQVDNLEWCTQKENVNYGTAQARRVASTDYKAIAAKIDYKARTAKIDYKARTAKIDYKAIAAKIDYDEVSRKRTEKISKQVYQYSLDGELIKIWQSVKEVGRNEFCQVAVSACCRNCYMREGNNVYKNFIWSYSPI